MRSVAFALAFIGVLTPGVCGDDVEKGRELAEALCAQCHLNKNQGEKQGPGRAGFAAVANRPAQTFDDILAWLSSVPPMMPNHHLTRDEMYALAAFIMSLREPDR